MTDYVSQYTGQQIDTAVGRVAVSASGTSSEGWGYRKWTDGKCEMWITVNITPTESVTSGSGYRTNTISLPSCPFAVLNPTVTGTADSACFIGLQTISSSGITIGIRLYRFSEIPTTSAVTVNICIDGTWQ